MTLDIKDILHFAINPVLEHLLPPSMNSVEARAMLIAIALQESRLDYRRQRPVAHARGYWQFERGGGVAGVLTHPLTKLHAREICARLDYDPSPAVIWEAIEDNDILAASFARLLLWTDYARLPAKHESSLGWAIYLRTWRPGKPHPQTWNAFFTEAWTAIDAMI